MSQKKVDNYKGQKANRQKNMQKERLSLIFEGVAVAAVCILMVAWIGYSAYAKIVGSQPVTVVDTVIDTASIDDYLSALSAEAE